MWQVHAPLLGWAFASILLGLGFTFFSGATEAWLVDALAFTGFKGSLESVFGRAQTVGGAAMLVGSVAGGFIAQATDLGVPYLLRAVMLGVTLVVAWWAMRPQDSRRLAVPTRCRPSARSFVGRSMAACATRRCAG